MDFKSLSPSGGIEDFCLCWKLKEELPFLGLKVSSKDDHEALREKTKL